MIPIYSTTTTSFISTDPSIISRGGICVLPNWISKQEVQALRLSVQDMENCGNYFQPSGLSNRVAGDTNEFGTSDRLTYTIGTADHDDKPLPDHYEVRHSIDQRLELLCQELQNQLNRSSLELAEQYYSISPASSFLPRHMDERHEDTKGERGWIVETRRSISWLLYLNSDDWNQEDNGGALRLFCRCTPYNVKCGSHEGDIQVGWLPCSETSSDDSNATVLYDPVFLDSWVKTPSEGTWEARSALYRLQQSSATTSTTSNTYRDYLSDPFGPDSPLWPSEPSLEPHAFAAALGKLLKEISHQKSFRGVEDLKGTHIVDVNPTGGSLVLFDSATLPHEVLATKQGQRVAMAGWFHEQVQDFPDWYGRAVDTV